MAMHETSSFEAIECSGCRRLGHTSRPGNTAHALVADVRNSTKDGELG
jgi:hypothetical protein